MIGYSGMRVFSVQGDWSGANTTKLILTRKFIFISVIYYYCKLDHSSVLFYKLFYLNSENRKKSKTQFDSYLYQGLLR